jgi:hypothetical protein
MIENSPPSSNPANTDTLLGAFNVGIKKAMAQFDVMLPARVIAFSFDQGKCVAQVQPMVPLVGSNNTTVTPRALIASVPVFCLGGGGFVINFDLQSGDEGWIKACDRDISEFLETGQNTKPNTFRTHNFSDGVFFPSVIRGVTISPADAGKSVWQNKSGTVKIALSQTGIELTASDTIVLTAPNVIIDGDTEITGKLLVDGDIASGGNITAAGDITPDTPP